MAESYTGAIFTWMKTAGGLTVTLSIIVAIIAGIDTGPYIIVNTIVTGGMLALVAMGLALIFGVMNIPMFAHGEFFMIGSLTAYYIFTPLAEYLTTSPSSLLAAIAPLIAIFGAVLAGTLGGVLCELLIFSQLRKRSSENWVMNSFLLTVGLSVVLVNAHQLLFGTEFKGIVRYWGGRPLEIMGVFVSRDRIMAFVLAMVVVGVFWLFMKYTNTGRAIRAVSRIDRCPDGRHQHKRHPAAHHGVGVWAFRHCGGRPSLSLPLLPCRGAGTAISGLVRRHPGGAREHGLCPCGRVYRCPFKSTDR